MLLGLGAVSSSSSSLSVLLVIIIATTKISITIISKSSLPQAWFRSDVASRRHIRGKITVLHHAHSMMVMMIMTPTPTTKHCLTHKAKTQVTIWRTCCCHFFGRKSYAPNWCARWLHLIGVFAAFFDLSMWLSLLLLSLYSFWSFVQWCCDAIARGKYPDTRHDKKDWSPSDAKRESVVGESLGFARPSSGSTATGWSTPRRSVCRHGPATLLPVCRAAVLLGIVSISLPRIFHRCLDLSQRTETTTRLGESAKRPLS